MTAEAIGEVTNRGCVRLCRAAAFARVPRASLWISVEVAGRKDRGKLYTSLAAIRSASETVGAQRPVWVIYNRAHVWGAPCVHKLSSDGMEAMVRKQWYGIDRMEAMVRN